MCVIDYLHLRQFGQGYDVHNQGVSMKFDTKKFMSAAVGNTGTGIMSTTVADPGGNEDLNLSTAAKTGGEPDGVGANQEVNHLDQGNQDTAVIGAKTL